MAECIGFDPKKVGLKANCANCKSWNGEKCHNRDLLNELYEESPKYKAIDRMMRGNRGITLFPN